MGMEYITSADWAEFNERFKDAASFLLAAELRGEREHLERMNGIRPLKGQQKSRLWDLRQLADEIAQIDKRLGAGMPFTIHVPKPITGETYYLQHEGFRLYRVTVLGLDGDFDRIPRYKYTWQTGPKAGLTESSYSQLFWRLPKDIEERRCIWNDMNDWERNKYKYLFPEEKFKA